LRQFVIELDLMVGFWQQNPLLRVKKIVENSCIWGRDAMSLAE
jgi:hypothetical protein